MRKICLITTSRADYGIQSRLIKLLQDEKNIDFSLVVSGMHICKKYGLTYREIEQDGIKITKMFDIGMDKNGNADPENQIIAQKIDGFVTQNQNAYAFSSLGAVRYLSLVNLVDVVVGNSSSGIIEVPSFKTATVNIGNRQKGRIQADSIINCPPQREDILKALYKAYSPEFRKKLGHVRNPYEGENTAQKILDVLKNVNLEHALKKKFYDYQ